jgi:hypothetical protein
MKRRYNIRTQPKIKIKALNLEIAPQQIFNDLSQILLRIYKYKVILASSISTPNKRPA